MISEVDAVEREAMALLERMLEHPEGARRSWLGSQTNADPRVARRAGQLLDTLERAGGRLATGAAQDDAAMMTPPRRVGAYKILELLGQGGMGAVFRARRDAGDFEHEVAIKLIRPGVLSDGLIERFEHERQILAKLVHPNIARLYDGGTTEDGGPFIVMEYIEGTPITDWVEAKALVLDERLTLFRLACGGVSHAHQNLIIHRDLTPNNVLVTISGEPKIIDFGIARPQQPGESGDGDEQGAAGLSLTPGFAAPERYTGAPATTLTDVYSLGKLLAELTADAQDADLRAIVEKATALKPDDRYPTANALSQDVERFRDGRPVEARPATRGYLIARFVARNRGAVLASLAAIVVLIAALVGMAIGFQRAQAAQAEAESRFQQVRAIANTLLFETYDAVDAVPGSTRARRLLASTAQHYLDALAGVPDAPFDLRLEAGRGYMRLADVMGGVGGGNLGLRDQALANYERADQLLTGLHEERPDNRDVALALADLRYARSNTMVHLEENMERGLAFARSIAPILDRACRAGDACTLRRAQAHVAEGQNLYWLERFDAAIAALDRGISALGGMASDARRAERAVRLEALAHRFKGDTVYYQEDVPGSVRQYDIAARLLREALDRGLDNPDIRRDLAIVEWTRGGSLDEMGRERDGVAALDRAYAIMETLVESDPDDAGSLRLLAVIGGQRGLTLSSAGRYREAILAAEASLAIRSRLSDMQPDQSGFFRDVAIQLNGLGDIHQRAGNRDEACRYRRAAIARFDRLAARWGMSDFDRNDTYARARQAVQSCGAPAA